MSQNPAQEKTPVVVHPLLVAAYPILFLYTQNMDVIGIGEIVLPLGVSLAGAAALWAATWLVFRNLQKAGLAASFFLALFFTFGHLFGPSKRLLALWTLLLVLGFFAIVLARYRPRKITQVVNVLSAGLVLFCAGSIALHQFKQYRQTEPVAAEEDVVAVTKTTGGPYRDIYYIILDAYGRSDTLKELYDFDNSEFLALLARKGFRVIPRATSNYCWTLLSLSSSLNMNYLPSLVKPEEMDTSERSPLLDKIRQSRTRRILRDYGYTYINLDDGMTPHLGGEHWFTTALLNTTMLSPLTSYLCGENARQSTLRMFEKLHQMPRQKGPKFVVAHVICPHPPYVFGPNGEAKPMLEMMRDAAYRRAGRYVDQVIYINRRVEQLVDDLIANSAVPPIIILQGDHGPDMTANWRRPSNTFLKERMRVLSAFYLPEGGDALLYDTMTPVNTFRVIFNHYFREKHALLKDRNFYTKSERPRRFTDVTELVK